MTQRQIADKSGFNPRAREGRDALSVKNGVLDARFNPRAREGRDGGG